MALHTVTYRCTPLRTGNLKEGSTNVPRADAVTAHTGRGTQRKHTLD